MDEKLEFAQRLKDGMQRAGYAVRPVVLEREFNTRYWGRSITLQAVRRWLRGEAIPSQDKLQVLAEWLKIEPHVLRYGEGVAKSVQEYRERWEDKMSHLERETIDAFLQLPAPQRKIIREVIMAFAEVYTSRAPDIT